MAEAGVTFDPRMALDRAIDRLPHCRERDRITEALIDDGIEDGQFPKYGDLATVGDVVRGGQGRLAWAGLDESDAAWLLVQLGGESKYQMGQEPIYDSGSVLAPAVEPQPKRKGGWPKGRKRKNADAPKPEA